MKQQHTGEKASVTNHMSLALGLLLGFVIGYTCALSITCDKLVQAANYRREIGFLTLEDERYFENECECPKTDL